MSPTHETVARTYKKKPSSEKKERKAKAYKMTIWGKLWNTREFFPGLKIFQSGKHKKLRSQPQLCQIRQ